MGKAAWVWSAPPWVGHCQSCHNQFKGPGDRCPKCVQKLRDRKRRKPR
jgi:rRNA maturation endonuclease Nob1